MECNSGCTILFLIRFKSKYSRLPITRTFKGNGKRFELSGVRVTESSTKIAERKVKKQFLLHSEHFNHI